jgi:hypothetical protein
MDAENMLRKANEARDRRKFDPNGRQRRDARAPSVARVSSGGTSGVLAAESCQQPFNFHL